ncbi:MAG: hypothetical protein NWR75_02960, partial [Ilumatobacteraceae bacterium]|nr:hypothetical protein [Ilumatobacteraceae bacterium]
TRERSKQQRVQSETCGASDLASHGDSEKTAGSSRKEVSALTFELLSNLCEKSHMQGKRTFLDDSTVYVL